MKEVKLQIWSF